MNWTVKRYERRYCCMYIIRRVNKNCVGIKDPSCHLSSWVGSKMSLLSFSPFFKTWIYHCRVAAFATLFLDVDISCDFISEISITPAYEMPPKMVIVISFCRWYNAFDLRTFSKATAIFRLLSDNLHLRGSYICKQRWILIMLEALHKDFA